MKKLLCLVLALAMTLALVACGTNTGNNTGNNASGNSADTQQGDDTTAPPENKGEPITDLITWSTAGSHELEVFMMLNAEPASDLDVLCNVYSGLLEVNNKGQLQPAVATEWGSEDGGLTWTFKLRDDVTWVDVNGNFKANCTAQDWLTAMEWILNFHKNGAKNTSMPMQLIAGATEYYNYTKDLTMEDAYALTADGKFAEMVGIEAPDDYTLVYTCSKNAPYFDTLCTSAALYPISQAEIDEKGVENMLSINNQNMWYNGAYTITTYIQNNEKILTRNEAYWDKLQSFNINGWGADYGDPENFLSQELYGNDNANYSVLYSNINDVDPASAPALIETYKEFTAMAEAAGQIYDDMDARYQAYVDAEVYLLQHALVLPCSYSVGWQLTNINDYSKKYALYGAQNCMYKNWETSTAGYTTAEYEAIKAAFNS